MELICDWFEACNRTSVGMAAHPIHGVIPVCGDHVALYGIPLITRTESEN